MPITNTIEGDLVKLAQEGRYNAIAHGCNCFCTMGSGIAPQIAKAFPNALEVDLETTKGSLNKLGKFTVGYYEELPKVLRILNLYTQYDFKKNSKGYNLSYDALTKCFSKLNEIYGVSSHFKLGIPQIGAGLAGGHWEAIENIINLTTPDLDIELVMYNG